MAKEQKVVRTYPTPKGYVYDVDTYRRLDELLRQGYMVVMCNTVGNDLEYILEKEK